MRFGKTKPISPSVLHHELIYRNTSFTLPEAEDNITIQILYSALIADETRNKLILDDILKSLEEGRSPILLTERESIWNISPSIGKKLVKNVIILTGRNGH